MNLNLTADPTAKLLNAEIARRESLPPFLPAISLPVAFLEVKDGFARVCAYHGRTQEERVENSKVATDWALAHGWRTSHGMCPDCFAREMAALNAPKCAAV